MLNEKLLNELRNTNPLVLNLTNTVVSNYVANGLLAIGASPIMAHTKEEMAELAQIVSAVSINIGTLHPAQIEAMRLAGKTANQHNKPVILDPVGVGATSYRQQVTNELLSEINFTAIRGNAGEMAQLAGVDWQSKGVDAGSGDGDVVAIAQTVAEKYQTITVISGEIDYVSDGNTVISIANGSPLFPKITGSGCLHGAVCAAFAGLYSDSPLATFVSACTIYACAGQIAEKPSMGPGGFTTALLDGLATIDSDEVAKLAIINTL